MTQDNKEAIVYQSDTGAITLRSDETLDTIWAIQKQMAQLFNVEVHTLNEHIKNIFSSQELEENPTIRKFRIV